MNICLYLKLDRYSKKNELLFKKENLHEVLLTFVLPSGSELLYLRFGDINI